MLKAFGITMSGRLLAAALQAGFVALLARDLGLGTFGVFATTSSVVAFTVAMLSLGTNTTVLRIRAEDDPSRSLSAVFFLRTAVFVLAIIAAGLISLLLDKKLGMMIFLSVLFTAGDSMSDLAVGLLQGFDRQLAAMVLLIVRRGVLVIVMLIGTPISAELCLLIGGISGPLVFLAIAWGHLGRPRGVVTFVKQRAPLIATNASQSFLQLDVFLVGIFAGLHVAGLYGAAARLLNPAIMAIMTLTQVLIPKVAAASDEDAKLDVFAQAKVSVNCIAVLLALSSITAPVAVPIVLGAQFEDAWPIVAGVLLGASAISYSQYYLSWFYATRLKRAVVVSSAVSVSLGLAGVTMGAALFGSWGAAAGAVFWRVHTWLWFRYLWREDVKTRQPVG